MNTTVSLNFQNFCKELQTLMIREQIPGLALGLLHEDEEYSSGLGITNIENSLPVQADTLFQIGSITKTFLATLVMRLVALGIVDLDVPLRTYLPELRLSDEVVAASATLRHLLTHTCGWVGDYFDDFGPGETALTQIIEQMAHLPQLTPLGTIWSYNNSGFYLAGRVVEVVTGLPFETAMQKLVFEPLDLQQAYFFAEDLLTYRFSSGHDLHGTEVKVSRPWAVPRSAGPAGGIVTNIPVLLRYARFHMGEVTTQEGKRLLSPEALALMQTPQFTAGDRLSIGLSWFIRDVEGLKVVEHGGATNGQTAGLFILPEQRFALAVLTNSSRGPQLYRQAFRSALATWLGVKVNDPIPTELPPEKLALYAGRYEAALQTLELTPEGGMFKLAVMLKGGFPTPDSPPPPSPNPVRAAFYAEDKLVVLDPPFKDVRADFVRDASGEIAWLRFGSRVHAREEGSGS